MTSIAPNGRFFAQIRIQVSELVRSSPDGKALESGAAKSKVHLSSDGLPELLPQRVLAITPNDPDRRRKAFSLFLESTLVNEFGESFQIDPSFHQLVKTVRTTMEANIELLPSIEQAGAYLIERAQQRAERS